MRLGVVAGMGSDWRQTLAKIQIAEDLGYERVTGTEAWGPSALPWITTIAANTSKIEVGTSIINAFSRTPAAIAQEFASIDVLSGGRAVLGIGSSGEYVVEHFHGVPFRKPLRRLREYIEIFNTLIGGGPLNYEGEIFNLQRGFRLDYDRPRDHIPVYVAAITPKSIRQTGEIADGIIPIHWPKSCFAELREQLAEGARDAGRDASTLTIAPQTHIYVLDGTDDEATWRQARQPLQFYINRMGVFYWQMLSRNGYEADVAASREAWANRDAEGSFAALSEEMVRDIQVIGTLEEVREQLRERAAAGADLQMVHLPPGDTAEVGRLLEALIK